MQYNITMKTRPGIAPCCTVDITLCARNKNEAATQALEQVNAGAFRGVVQDGAWCISHIAQIADEIAR